MKVLLKHKLSDLLDSLNRNVGEIFGPIHRFGDEIIYGLRIGKELDLDSSLPINSPKDVLLSRIKTAKKVYEKTGTFDEVKPIALLGVKPCDMRAFYKIIKKISFEGVETEELFEKIFALVVTNACLYPELNCFCTAAGGNPVDAPNSDWVLFNLGEKYLIDCKTERGQRALEDVSAWLTDATEDDEKKLESIKRNSLQTNRISDLAKAVESFNNQNTNDECIRPFVDQCLDCGACAHACPMYVFKFDEMFSDDKTSKISIEDKAKRLPYVKILQSAIGVKKEEWSCEGCGRCSTLCPQGLGMIELLDMCSGKPRRNLTHRPQSLAGAYKWIAPIRHKMTTTSVAFGNIKPGDCVFIASGCAEPRYLATEFMKNYEKFLDLKVIHLLSMGAISFDDPKLTDHIRLNAFFVGDQSRKAVQSGQADYTPVLLAELPGLFRKKQINIDVALIQVSPPNSHGYCSLGISVETIKAAVESARYVVAQVNPQMPFTYGESNISIDEIDAIVAYDEPLIEWRPPVIKERSSKIGQYIASLIDDRATLQIGIGKIGQALLPFLQEKKDLGIHTQIITDEVIKLMEMGVVTNKYKNLHSNKTIASFAVGTNEIYSKLDKNPSVEFYGMDYISDPKVIAKNKKMAAINSVFEIDLAGQVCADSINHQFYSGIASIASFLRGAAGSKGGKPIIALPSTAKNGEYSRILPYLSHNQAVAVTMGDVHYVVTEYGIANLHGKSIRERALALIEIAHPKFRKWLLEEAKKLKYIFEDQELPSLSQHLYPEIWETTITTKDGEELFVRPIRATDEASLQRLYYSLNDQDVFFRFMGNDKHFRHNRMQAMTVLDYDQRMAIVATKGEVGNEEIMGIARYDIDPKTKVAEVAFTVREDMRRKTIGTKLLEHISVIAKSRGAKSVRAEILARNKAMMNLFKTSGAEIHSHLEDGMYSMWYEIEKES